MMWPVLDAVIAVSVTFGVARYGLGAVFVVLPWLLCRSSKRTWPWGRFAVAALALSAAIAVGVAGFGDFGRAAWAAAIQAFIWVHVTGRGTWLWGGLGSLGLVLSGFALIWQFLANPSELAAASASWWQAWHSWLLAALACGSIWLLLRFPSKNRPFPGSSLALAERVAVGRGGEWRVRVLLLDGLPADTWVLSNVHVPGFMGDADLLVIGSSGLFLIEVKSWSGQITCGRDGKSWRRITTAGRLETLSDPGAQVRRTIRALRAYLETADAMLCMRTELWIEGLAVFAHPRARVDGRSCPVPVLISELWTPVAEACQ